MGSVYVFWNSIIEGKGNKIEGPPPRRYLVIVVGQ